MFVGNFIMTPKNEQGEDPPRGAAARPVVTRTRRLPFQNDFPPNEEIFTLYSAHFNAFRCERRGFSSRARCPRLLFVLICAFLPN